MAAKWTIKVKTGMYASIDWIIGEAILLQSLIGVATEWQPNGPSKTVLITSMDSHSRQFMNEKSKKRKRQYMRFRYLSDRISGHTSLMQQDTAVAMEAENIGTSSISIAYDREVSVQIGEGSASMPVNNEHPTILEDGLQSSGTLDEQSVINDEIHVREWNIMPPHVPQGNKRSKHTLLPPDQTCKNCGAVMWKEERSKNVPRGKGDFSICCANGKAFHLSPVLRLRKEKGQKKKKMRSITCLLFLLSLLCLSLSTTRSILEVGDDDENQCVYTVYIRTSTMLNGGTDSVIGLSLATVDGPPFTIPDLISWGGLMGPNNNSYFERGNLDIFSGRGPCLTPCWMNLTSDGSGVNPGWYCNYVEVTYTGPHLGCGQQLFTVEQWLARDAPPYQLYAVRDKCPKAEVPVTGEGISQRRMRWEARRAAA